MVNYECRVSVSGGKENKNNDSLSSGERKGKSPNHKTCFYGVVGPAIWNQKSSRRPLERGAKQGDSPVSERLKKPSWHLSRAGHVKPGLNLGGPPPKAKY